MVLFPGLEELQGVIKSACMQYDQAQLLWEYMSVQAELGGPEHLASLKLCLRINQAVAPVFHYQRYTHPYNATQSTYELPKVASAILHDSAISMQYLYPH